MPDLRNYKEIVDKIAGSSPLPVANNTGVDAAFAADVAKRAANAKVDVEPAQPIKMNWQPPVS